jgi:indole-3-glycerol phosphate synthase
MTRVAADWLRAIVAATERTVAARARACSEAELARAAATRQPRGEAFVRALATSPTPRIVAECKRRSPARGVLRGAYDAAALARAYARAGAAAVSVLTEPAFFDGTLDDLRAVRQAVAVPVLRKDFVVSSYQILEARAAGADAVLLIVAALPGERLRSLVAEAREQGLAALVEVHDEDELDRALEAGATVVGVNSRNLHTLEVDLAVVRRLIDAVPDAVVAVAESGLRAAREIAELQALGYDAFLVGERLVTAPDPGAALAALREEVAAPTDGESSVGGRP